MFEFFLYCIVIESTCYFINHERVKLFLEKEKSKMQEQQTTEILQKVPLSVLVIDKKQSVIFKNQQLDAMAKNICKALCSRDTLENSNFDCVRFFMRNRLLQPETADGEFEDQQVPTVSLIQVITADQLRNKTARFCVHLDDQEKMVLSITMQRILLSGLYYNLLLFEN